MAYQPYSTEALLRALSAPPSLGDFSATQAVNYLSPGIGVGPGGQMVMKDQAGIDAAARRMQAEMDRVRAANPYAGLVFGDSIGQAQGQALNLRAQRVAEAQNAARLAMAQQAQILDAEARRQAAALNERIRQDNLRVTSQDRQDAIAQRERDSQRDFLSQLSSRVQAPSTGQPALDVQALLQNQAGVRGQLAGVETGMANVYQDMLDAARAEAAWQSQNVPGAAFTVSPGTGRDQRPQIQVQGEPNNPAQLAQALAAIQTAMRSYVPASSWDPNTPLPDLTGTGGEYIPGGIDREAILRELAARQATGNQQLASLQDVFRARGSLNSGSGAGSSGSGTARGGNLTPAMFLQLAQLGLQPAAQAPTPVGPMAQQAVPLTLLDRAWSMGPSNAPSNPQELARQAAWYAANPAIAQRAGIPGYAAETGQGSVPSQDPGQIQALLAQLAQSLVPPLAPAQAPAPEPVTAQYRMQGGNLVPVGAPQAAAEAAPSIADLRKADDEAVFLSGVQQAYRERVKTAPTGAAQRNALAFADLDEAVAKRLGIEPEQIGSSKLKRSPAELVAANRDRYLEMVRQKFGETGLRQVLLQGLKRPLKK